MYNYLKIYFKIIKCHALDVRVKIVIYKSPYSVEIALNNQNAQIANVSYLKIKYHRQKCTLVVKIKLFLIVSGVVVMLKKENRNPHIAVINVVSNLFCIL